MFNGYVDLGTWSGITPYVGAGVGFAYNKLFGFTDTGYAYSDGVQSPTGGYSDDGGKWNFAWGLMAGLSFDVTQNLKLDLGYRYLDYGKFTSGVVALLDARPAARLLLRRRQLRRLFQERPRLQRLAHRSALDDRRRATPPPQLPLVRKY